MFQGFLFDKIFTVFVFTVLFFFQSFAPCASSAELIIDHSATLAQKTNTTLADNTVANISEKTSLDSEDLLSEDDRYHKIINNYLAQKKKVKISVNNFCIPQVCRAPVSVNVNAEKVNDVKKVETKPRSEYFYKKYLYQSMLNSSVSEKTATAIIDNVSKIEKVQTLDRNQPENKLNFEKYLKIVGFEVSEDGEISASRVLKSIKERYLQNKQEIDSVAFLMNVDKEVLLAIWHNETRCGKIKGSFSLIDALYTLAYDGRRGDFFEKEFILTAKLIDLNFLDIYAKSSWAGAVGDFQTMPSVIYGNYIHFKANQESYDKSFQKCLATGANYLNRIGYSIKMPTLIEVRFNKDFDMCSLGGFKNKKKVSELLSLGVEIVDPIYKMLEIKQEDFLNLSASIINPDCNENLASAKKDNEAKFGKFYMVFDNYLSILSWNRSNFYASAVGILANQIKMDADFHR